MALFDSITTTDDGSPTFDALSANGEYLGFNFTPASALNVESVEFSCLKPWPHLYNEDIVAEIYNVATAVATGVPTGTAIAYAIVTNASLLTTDYTWTTFTFDANPTLNPGTRYVIQARAAVSTVSGDVLRWWITNTYDDADTKRMSSANQGGTWSFSTSDVMFKLNGASPATLPADIDYETNLVTFSGDRVYYGPSATALSEITAARSDIDCTKTLTAEAAFGQVFIANETNLKVLDFKNTKIYTDAVVTTIVTARGETLVGTDSGAQMLIDFVTDSSGTCELYGKALNTIAFTSADTVIYSSSNTLCAFANASTQATAPLWYTWTPFADDTNVHGSMPSDAKYVFQYRARIGLAGEDSDPHHWYMPKVANPWEWNYDSTDPLSAVAGQSADAGDTGGVIKAPIAFGDDFMVFGCTNYLHLLTGDPARGGSMDEISRIHGIWGHKAWCKDQQGNLYFYNSDGLCKMENGRSKPVSISNTRLPNLYKDIAADPNTHRIVLLYDVERHGIIITRSALTAGTNDGYFYDLTLEAFYPEDYPADCGIFCGLYYDASSSHTVNLVLGANDGYLRTFDNDTKSDVLTTDNYSAITAYFGWVEQLTNDEDRYGKLNSVTVETAGGAASGTFADSDNCNFDIFTADTAEECMEDILDGATPFYSTSLVSVGRQPIIRQKARGAHIGFKFTNSTISESFAINRLYGSIKQSGRIP